MKYIAHIYLGVCSFIIIGVAVTAAFWLFWPYNVLTTYSDKLPVITHVVKAGGEVEWRTDVTQNTSGVQVEVVKQLEDGAIINFATTGYVTKRGRQTFIASQHIPSFVGADTYHIVVASSFKVNPIRVITIVRETEDFQVVR
jgi:hypothetical protein